MMTIVVGGHSRKVGKTSITAGLIKVFNRYPWTAIKISTHWHEDPPEGTSFVIHEEKTGGELSDSARFLAAGAARSFWIRIREECIEASLPVLLPVLQSSPFVIIESNCILRLIQPDLYILVLRSDVEDFKESARETLHRAHAIVMVESGVSSAAWKDLVQTSTAGIPLFSTQDPNVLPPELLDFVGPLISNPGFRN
jgi:hypothetical protein